MERVFIIAEAGVNHNGSLDMAIEMISAAVAAGADAVKFQTFKADKVISRFAPKARYQIETTGEGDSQLNMARKLEFNPLQHETLIRECAMKGIRFLSTPFDMESIELLHHLKLDTFKIPSGEITHLPYLRRIGALKKKILLSTGMADLGEIEDAIDILVAEGTSKTDITLLHCTTEYPTPMEEVNLKAMLTLKAAFGCPVGYSDHSPGIEVPVAAAALGARVLEKHFTLDKTMEGPDHRASLEPGELKAMVIAIRNIEKALGSGVKKPSPSEGPNREIVRRSIVAGRQIGKGELFTEENILCKRPGTGISPMEWDRVIGRRAVRNYNEDELITL